MHLIAKELNIIYNEPSRLSTTINHISYGNVTQATNFIAIQPFLLFLFQI